VNFGLLGSGVGDTGKGENGRVLGSLVAVGVVGGAVGVVGGAVGVVGGAGGVLSGFMVSDLVT
jgi:hypothetical protein